MSPQLVDLIITVGVATFLGVFVTIWLWEGNKSRPGTFHMPIKKYRAIIRLVQYGKTPVLCGNHAKTLIQRKGKMAVVDNSNCEICTHKSKLV